MWAVGLTLPFQSPNIAAEEITWLAGMDGLSLDRRHNRISPTDPPHPRRYAQAHERQDAALPPTGEARRSKVKELAGMPKGLSADRSPFRRSASKMGVNTMMM